MADTKLTGLTENTTPVSTDIMYIVDDPGSSPLSQKITLANLKTLINDLATAAIWDAAGDLVQGTGANTGAKLTIGTANQLLRVNSGATAVEWASVGRVLISELTPTGTSASFTSIPATYKSLWLEWVARTDAAATSENIKVYFNNDTTDTNYYREETQGMDTSSSSGEADTSYCGAVAAANAAASDPGIGYAEIPYYAATTFHKMALFMSGERRAAAQQTVRINSVNWEDTSAINRVDILTAGGNFVSGTTFRLYGVN